MRNYVQLFSLPTIQVCKRDIRMNDNTIPHIPKLTCSLGEENDTYYYHITGLVNSPPGPNLDIFYAVRRRSCTSCLYGLETIYQNTPSLLQISPHSPTSFSPCPGSTLDSNATARLETTSFSLSYAQKKIEEILAFFRFHHASSTK